MNILQVVHAYYPSLGGSQQLARGLSERLARDYGDQVTVYTTVADDLAYFWREGRSLPPGVEQINGVTVRRFPVYRGLRFLRRAISSLTYRLRLPSNDWWRTLEQGPIVPGLTAAIAASGADVIMAQAFPLRHMYDALAGAKRANTPLIYLGELHPHDTWGYDRAMIYRAIHQADGYIALTAFERDAVIARGADPAKVWTIGAGVDAVAFAQAALDSANGATMRQQLGWGDAPDEPVVLMLGKQVARKRYDLLIPAMAQVWAKLPAARLVLAGGKTGYSTTINALLGQLSPEQQARVTLVPSFSDDDKTALLAAADVVVLPSAEESFGIVLLEAWACGKPVVGAGTGAVGSLINHGVDGLHYRYPDAVSLGQAIQTLLAQPDLRARLGQAGQAKVQAYYTWERVTAQVRAVYTEVIARRQTRLFSRACNEGK